MANELLPENTYKECYAWSKTIVISLMIRGNGFGFWILYCLIKHAIDTLHLQRVDPNNRESPVILRIFWQQHTSDSALWT